jgi:predicted Rossmann fold flavoprotein
MNVAIIGGGAAGFFAAIAVKENFAQANVTIYEKSQHLLSKVKISGGGRCNVTNGTKSIKELTDAYPRGGKALKYAFNQFNTVHTMEWFESRGVPLLIQEDNCVFPVSQNSQSIIDCLMNQVKANNIEIVQGAGVERITRVDNGYHLEFGKEGFASKTFDAVIVATGGSPKRRGLDWLEALGHKIEEPVPSLFTFNMPNESIKELMGIVVEETIVRIQGTKRTASGPLLITHWGMSGPAILKLSAFGARILSERHYSCVAQVNWVNEQNDNLVAQYLNDIIKSNPQNQLGNYRPYALPERLWIYLLAKAELDVSKKWVDLGKKGMNKLVTLLTNDQYEVRGKTTFKEEFVTCGGVSLESIDMKTMQSKLCPGLFFTGEVMDVDGITGGYNFQAAWTTAHIAGRLGR